MARQRRTLDEQIAELVTRGRNERTTVFSTPAMAPLGPSMILDNAILNEHLADGAVALSTLDEDLKATLDSLADNEVVITEATKRLDEEAERIDSLFDDVAQVPEQIAAAQEAAIAAAAADATAKAEAAQAAAAATAAEDAKAKADAAQKAALAAAKQYTDAQETGVSESDLEAIRQDATTKADAAKEAAIAAAALDATAKQEAAEATAAADAKAKADAALAAAKSDAATKADKALADAKTDATTKANKALADAKADAKAKADAAQAAAITAAAADATAKAEQAESNAAAAAAADAQERADKAQEAARLAAEAYASAQVTEATGALLASAKLDAQVMADAAEAAAIAAAAADATAKKEQAEATAAADAKKKADAALASAKTDAANKANAAQAAAEAAAAADAKAKADAALAAAKADTIEKMNDVANSKNATFYGTAVPTATNPKGSLAGDTYRRKDSSGNIIGEYEWSGTAWAQRKMTSASMTAVDVGVLTAGSAVLNSAVAKKIAAATASFQEAEIGNLVVTGQTHLNEAVAKVIAADTATFIKLNVGNLVAGEGVMDKGVINTLYSQVVESRRIRADQVLIGTGGNLFPDPGFLDAAGFPSSHKPVPGAGRHGGNALIVPALDVQAGAYYGNTNRDYQFAVAPSTSYRVSAWVKPEADVPAASVAVYMKWSNPSTSAGGNFVPSPTAISNTEPLVAGEWVEIAGIMTTPPEAAKAFIGFYVQKNAVVEVAFCDPAVQQATNSALLVNGAVTADKLEANLVLTNRVIAGDPNGVRAEMSPQGFKVFGKASGDTTSTGTYEIVRLGVADTNDMFAIADKDGITQASISETGVVSGKEVYASEDIIFKGKRLSEILWDLPHGHIASAFRYDSSAYNAKAGGEWAPYLRLEVNLERNRLYKISTSPIKYGQDPGGNAAIRIVQATGAVATIANGVTINTVDINDGGDGNAVTLCDYAQIGGAVNDGPADDVVMVSYLLMFKSSNKQFGIRASGYQPVRLMIEDMGPLRNTFTGIHLDTTSSNGVPPAAPPAKSTHTTTWDCNFIKSYTGNGSYYNYNVNKGYQGLSPAGYGNMKTIMKFPDMTGTLSGSTIHDIKVYLYFEHWYYNAGGTARIALAGGGDTSSYTGQNPVVTSGGWPKPGGRWVTIPPGHYYGFQTGTYRGITLEGDGTYGSYGIAHPGKIQITYTK